MNLDLFLDDLYDCHTAYVIYDNYLSPSICLSDKQRNKVKKYSLIDCKSIKEYLEKKYIKYLEVNKNDNYIFINNKTKDFCIIIDLKKKDIDILFLDDDNFYKDYIYYSNSSIIWFNSLI